jgi:hypothetical protein
MKGFDAAQSAYDNQEPDDQEEPEWTDDGGEDFEAMAEETNEAWLDRYEP